MPHTELTLALVKPDAIRQGHLRSITSAMEHCGFVIVASTRLQLTRVVAEELYQDHQQTEHFDKLTRFICSAQLYAFIIGKKNAIAEWHTLMGHMDPHIARTQSPSSLRARYGTNMIQNAVHGSGSCHAAKREIKIFFPSFIMDPLQNEIDTKDYFNAHLRKTIVKGLTTLAKAKPHNDPLEVIVSLS